MVESGGPSTGAVSIHFNVNAIDGQDAADFIGKNSRNIANAVAKELKKKGLFSKRNELGGIRTICSRIRPFWRTAMKSIFVLLVAVAAASAQSTAKPTRPVHLSEYMQRVGLIYLETVDAEMKSVASTLNGDNQEHLLDQLEDRIKITLQRRDDGPEKDADTDYLTLLETLRSIAIGAGMDINQGKSDGSGVKAWAPCYALAHSAAVSGVIFPQMKQKCDDANAIYQRDSAAAYELARACDKLKKAKDQKKCREGRIPPPS